MILFAKMIYGFCSSHLVTPNTSDSNVFFYILRLSRQRRFTLLYCLPSLKTFILTFFSLKEKPFGILKAKIRVNTGGNLSTVNFLHTKGMERIYALRVCPT